jgi:hypothetical protein
LQGSGWATAALLLGSSDGPKAAGAPTASAPPVSPKSATLITVATPAASPTACGLLGLAFNAKAQDVTLFDPATLTPLATKPLGATVRWLSNEQRFWDGRFIWTYDFPDNRVVALAVDPVAFAIARTLPTGGTGPAHSLMLTPDRKTAWVNIAGDNRLAVLDVDSGEMVAQVPTGKFP